MAVTIAGNAALRSILRGDTGDSYATFLIQLARASDIATASWTRAGPVRSAPWTSRRCRYVRQQTRANGAPEPAFTTGCSSTASG